MPPTDLSPGSLRDWPLPDATGSKYQRGQVLVIGGAARTPGAAQLTGIAALRVGAGHLTLAVAESAAIPLAVATPEAGVIGLAQNASGSVLGDDLGPVADRLASADVVVIGPGLDDVDQTAALLQRAIPELGPETRLLLDAYALAPLPKLEGLLAGVRDRLVLTPNSTEAETLLGREPDDLPQDVATIADRYGAVVSCQNVIADPSGAIWQVNGGHAGLATSGSGDVMAGALAGLLARGAEPSQAACWAAWLHAAAGDRLAAAVGRLGFLAREIADTMPAVLVELES